MGEELDEGELLPRGREEGVQAGGVEVHGVLPLCGGPGPRLVADAQRLKGVRAPREGGGDSTNNEEDSRHRGGHGIGKELDLTGPARRGSGDPSRHIRTSREEGRSPVGVVVGQRRDWRGIGGAREIEWISNQGGKGRLRPWLWSPTVLKW